MSATPPRMRIGLLRLTDGAPVILAHEFGFFADEGLEVDIAVEPSWANIADKLAFGALDAAVIVPPLAFAVQLGLRGGAQPLIVPSMVSAGGNTVTLERRLADETAERAAQAGMPRVQALAEALRARPLALGVVHAYSTHNLLLRYWLATAGIEAGRDVRLVVVPPARAVEALAAGQIAGFCAGAPWGAVARRAQAGAAIATSGDIWAAAPEKAFAVRARWAEAAPEALAAALRALLRAAQFCDQAENSTYTAALLSRRRYVDVDSHALLTALPGGTAPLGGGCRFFAGAATFPWRSQALWFLDQMRRWGLVADTVDLRALAAAVYRPDLYRAALAPAGLAVPAADWKPEGAHDQPWALGTIAMPADRFCDGTVFDPDRLGAVHNN